MSIYKSKISRFLLLLMCILFVIFSQCPAYNDFILTLIDKILYDKQNTYIKITSRESEIAWSTLNHISDTNPYYFLCDYNIEGALDQEGVGIKMKVSWQVDVWDRTNPYLRESSWYTENRYFETVTKNLDRDENGNLNAVGFAIPWDGSSNSSYTDSSPFESIKPTILKVEMELFGPNNEQNRMFQLYEGNPNYSDFNELQIFMFNQNDIEIIEFNQPNPPEEVDPYNIDFNVGYKVKVVNKSTRYNSDFIKMKAVQLCDQNNDYSRKCIKDILYGCAQSGQSSDLLFGTLNFKGEDFVSTSNDPNLTYLKKPIIITFERTTCVEKSWGIWIDCHSKSLSNPCKIIDMKNVESNLEFDIPKPNIKLNELIADDFIYTFSPEYVINQEDENEFQGICMQIDRGQATSVSQLVDISELTIGSDSRTTLDFDWDGKMSDGSFASIGDHKVRIGFKFHDGTWPFSSDLLKEKIITIREGETDIELILSGWHEYLTDVKLSDPNFTYSPRYYYYIKSDEPGDIQKLAFSVQLGNNAERRSIIETNPVTVEPVYNANSIVWDGLVYNENDDLIKPVAEDNLTFKLGFLNSSDQWLSDSKYYDKETVTVEDENPPPVVTDNTLELATIFVKTDLEMFDGDIEEWSCVGYNEVRTWKDNPVQFDFNYSIDENADLNEVNHIVVELSQETPNGVVSKKSYTKYVQRGENEPYGITWDGVWTESIDSEYPELTMSDKEDRPLYIRAWFEKNNNVKNTNEDEIEHKVAVLICNPEKPYIEIRSITTSGATGFGKALVVNETKSHSFDINVNDPTAPSPNIAVVIDIFNPTENVADPAYYNQVWFDLTNSSTGVKKSSNLIKLNSYKTISKNGKITTFAPTFYYGGQWKNCVGEWNVQAKLQYYAAGKLLIDANDDTDYAYATSRVSKVNITNEVTESQCREIPIDYEYFENAESNPAQYETDMNYILAPVKLKIRFGTGQKLVWDDDYENFGLEYDSNTGEVNYYFSSLFDLATHMEFLKDRDEYAFCIGVNNVYDENDRLVHGFSIPHDIPESQVGAIISKTIGATEYVHELGHMFAGILHHDDLVAVDNLDSELCSCIMCETQSTDFSELLDKGILIYQNEYNPHFCRNCVYYLNTNLRVQVEGE